MHSRDHGSHLQAKHPAMSCFFCVVPSTALRRKAETQGKPEHNIQVPVSSLDIMDSPSFCLSGIVPFQPPKQITDFNPINFLDLLGFLYIYCQPLFDLNKDFLTKYNKFHAHISGDAMMENMNFCICSFDIQKKMFTFSISFPLHIFKRNRKATSNCYFFKCLLNYEFTWPFLQ